MRDQTIEELQDRERDLAEQLFALRLQKVTGQLEKPVAGARRCARTSHGC